MDDWLISYRSYTDEELASERAFLVAESRNIYVSQGLGQKTNQRDLTGVRNRLSAVVRVQAERAGHPVIRDSVADFSGGAGGGVTGWQRRVGIDGGP